METQTNELEEKIIDLNVKIQELLNKRKEIFKNMKSHIKKLKYLKIENAALEKLLKDYNEKELQKLQIMLKSMEFKVQTKALTAKKERELLKHIMEIEKKIASYRPMIKAKKRKKIIEEEMKKVEDIIKNEEEKIKALNKEIDSLFNEKRKMEKIDKNKKERQLSLTEIAVIEKKEENKKNKKASDKNK